MREIYKKYGMCALSFIINFLFWIKKICKGMGSYKEELIVISTIVTAFFTATMWFTTNGLYKLAIDQSKDTRASIEIARESAQAAKILADSANQNVVMMRQQLRAAVFVESGFVLISPDKSTLNIHMTVRNAGQTPAYKFSHNGLSGVADPKQFPKLENIKLSQNSEIMLIQGHMMNMDKTKNVTEGEIEAIKNGVKVFRFWGKFSYFDAFNEVQTYEYKYRISGPTSIQRYGNVVGEGWPLEPDPGENGL